MPNLETLTGKHILTSIHIHQLDPDMTKSGLLLTCSIRKSVCGRNWLMQKIITSNITLSNDCSLIEKELKTKLNNLLDLDHLHEKLLPFQIKIIELGNPLLWEFPITGFHENQIYLIKIIKIKTSVDIKGKLIDPKPKSQCSTSLCIINDSTLLFRKDLSSTSLCRTVKIMDTKGALIFDESKMLRKPRFISTISEIELNFPLLENNEVACVSHGQPIYYSEEGALVSFEPEQGVCPLYTAYHDFDYIGFKTWMGSLSHLRETRSLTNNFDIVPLSSQASWIYSKITSNEANLMYYVNQLRNDSLADFLNLRHISCQNLFYIKTMAFHLFSVSPENWIKIHNPNTPFIIKSLNPTKVIFGTTMITRYRVGICSCTDNGIIIHMKEMSCEIKNITGEILSCRKTAPFFYNCVRPILPMLSGVYLDTCTGEEINIETKIQHSMILMVRIVLRWVLSDDFDVLLLYRW